MTALTFDEDEIARAARGGQILEWMRTAGLDSVHVALIDPSGTLREKRLSPAAAARALESGWSFIDAIGWWGPDDDVGRSGGSAHQPATIDMGSGRRHPFDDNSAIFLADFDGPMAALSPRRQVEKMVARLASAGLVCDIGWEYECILLESTAALASGETSGLEPALPDNRCWSSQTMATEAATIEGWTSALAGGDVTVDHICAELGPGCLELALEHRGALRAADDAAWAKIFTKAFFAQRGLVATFMAQVSDAFPGLGGHPSISLRSADDGLPAVAQEDGALSPIGLAAIAGIVTLLPELLVMATPTPNSYRRFGPGNWAPATATWGIGNYSCALRVVADHPEATRLELRIPGADTGPHLCTAMALGAAVWGIEQGLEAPPPVLAPQDGRNDSSSPPLPRDLIEAAQHFAESAAADDLFGAEFVAHYAAGRMAEAHACKRFVSAQERLRYLRGA
jgi:glutamine synthetase